MSMHYDTILIRYGETFLKKGRRSFFISVLKHNLQTVLGPGFILRELYGFLCVERRDGQAFEFDADIRAILDRTFGVFSYSPAIALPLELSAIENAFANLNDAFFAGVNSFRVSTTRSFKGFPLNSMQMNRRLGAIVQATRGLRVDLEHPDLDLGLLIHNKKAFLFPGTYKGPGGLPVGASGRAVLLLSGGIDSPVAGLLVMKRGVRVLPVTFQCEASGLAGLEKVRDLAGRLSDFQGATVLFYMNADAWKQAFIRRLPARYRLVILRRFMLRAAERVARVFEPALIVTGDSIGQVASQTIENLITTQSAVNAMVVRPLSGFDKLQTMDAARHYGTYAISIRNVADCCEDFTPKHPETRATPAAAAKLEDRLNVEDLLARVLGTLRVQTLPLDNAVSDTLLTIYYRLRLLFGHRDWWPGDTQLEIVVGAVLTQNTAWTNVERAIANMKSQGLLDVQALLDAPQEALEAAIRPAGYFRIKRERLRSVIKALVDKGGPDFKGFESLDTNDFREFLLGIKGVGPETADSILLYAFNRPVFVVDTYTRRILGRMGILSGKETYDEIQALVVGHLPKDIALYNDFHAQLVNLAKDFCKTRPVCNTCPLHDICPKK